MADIAKLKTLLASPHPVSGAWEVDDAAAAAQGNEVDMEKDVETVAGQDIFEAVVPADFFALDAENQALFLGIVGMGTVKVNGTNTKAALVAMFAGKTNTLEALGKLQKRNVSLFQLNGVGLVRTGEIMEARA